jgi:hypothetical protein
MRPNFRHYSRSPRCQTLLDPLDSDDPPSTSKKVGGCQILLKIKRKIVFNACCRINNLPTL